MLQKISGVGLNLEKKNPPSSLIFLISRANLIFKLINLIGTRIFVPWKKLKKGNYGNAQTLFRFKTNSLSNRKLHRQSCKLSCILRDKQKMSQSCRQNCSGRWPKCRKPTYLLHIVLYVLLRKLFDRKGVSTWSLYFERVSSGENDTNVFLCKELSSCASILSQSNTTWRLKCHDGVVISSGYLIGSNFRESDGKCTLFVMQPARTKSWLKRDYHQQPPKKTIKTVD